jgi:hypothetical protein
MQECRNNSEIHFITPNTAKPFSAEAVAGTYAMDIEERVFDDESANFDVESGRTKCAVNLSGSRKESKPQFIQPQHPDSFPRNAREPESDPSGPRCQMSQERFLRSIPEVPRCTRRRRFFNSLSSSNVMNAWRLSCPATGLISVPDRHTTSRRDTASTKPEPRS